MPRGLGFPSLVSRFPGPSAVNSRWPNPPPNPSRKMRGGAPSPRAPRGGKKDQGSARRVHFGDPEYSGHLTCTPTEALELLRHKIIRGVGMASPARRPRSACYPGTRLHLLEKVTYWRGRTPQPWRDVFWVTGPAGCGKSAIAQTLARVCEKDSRLGAALFFSRTNKHIEISRIVPTIAFQLAHRDPSYRNFIASVFSKYPTILEEPIQVQFKELLRDPGWARPIEEQRIALDPLVIILDGLDECGDDVAQLLFAELIDNHIRNLRHDPPFLWVIFSRPESQLKQTFAKFDRGKQSLYGTHIVMSVSDPFSMQDVVRFLQGGFSDIRKRYSDRFHLQEWPTQEHFAQVVHASSGYFPFASCILEFVGNETQQNPVAQLAMCLDFFNNHNPDLSTTQLFHSIDEIYRQVLSGIGEKDLPTVLDILRFCVSNSGGSYTLTSIQFALRTPLTQIQHALQGLHSVLEVPSFKQAGIEGPRFYHSSFPEFLRDPRRSGKYTIQRSPQGTPKLGMMKTPQVSLNTDAQKMNIVDDIASQLNSSITLPSHGAIAEGIVYSEPTSTENSVANLNSTPSELSQPGSTKRISEIATSLLSRVLKTSLSRKALCNLKGDQAQLMMDYLYTLLLEPVLPLPWLPKHTLIALRELSKTSLSYPHCYYLKDIAPDSHETGGAFSDIYKGKHGDSLLCLKVIRLHQKSEMENMLKVYAKEAILWGQLHHPNIAPFYGIYYLNEARRQVCLVSPWMNNGSLVDYLKEHPSAPRSPFIFDVTAGLEYLHSKSLIHGDIKGKNILVNDSERACITDFGLSLIRTNQTLAYTFASSTVHGFSHHWAAPELLEDDARPTLASDMWALGCVFYEIITGLLPYGILTDAQIIRKLTRGERPTRPNPTLDPDPTEDVIWKLASCCWELRTNDRPTCQDILGVLEQNGIVREHEDIEGAVRERQEFRNAMRKNEEVPLDFGKIEQLLNELCVPANEQTEGSSPEG